MTDRPSSMRKSSRQQGIQLGGVSIFRFDEAGHFRDRIEAKSATLEPGYWRLEEARFLVPAACSRLTATATGSKPT